MKSRCLLLLLLCVCLRAPAASLPAGSSLSLAVEKTILKAGFTPSRIPLATTGQDVFPYNITVDFPCESQKQENNTKLLFAFMQEDVWQASDAFSEFLRAISQAADRPAVTVLCAAGDKSPAGLASLHTGTAEYANAVKEFETPAVVVVTLTDSCTVFMGSFRRTTPRWLTEIVFQALYEKKAVFSFPTAVTSFYRLGFIQADARMEAFMREAIPAVHLTLPENTDFSVLTALCAHYPTAEKTAEWDSHYLVIPFFYPLKACIIGERAFVISAFVLSTFSILLLCAFTFSGADARKQRKRAAKSWFMLPLTVGILFCAILLSQAVAVHIPIIKSASALVKLSFKVVLAALIVSIFFAVQELLKAPVGLFVYGDLPLYVAACNIFLFAAIDLQFFLPFVIEYAIIYRVRKTDDVLRLILALLAMLIPVSPYVYTIMANSRSDAITQLIFCSWRVNLLLALLFFPFQVIWLRILLWFKLYHHAGKVIIQRALAHNAISIAVIIGCFIGIAVSLTLISNKLTPETEKKATIILRDRDTVHVSLASTTFSDLTTEHVTITSDVEAVRYSLELEATAGAVPLYDANYAFSLDENAAHAQFDIPDFPPKAITVDYAFSSETSGTLTVTALYRTDTPSVYRQEVRTLAIIGSRAHKDAQ